MTHERHIPLAGGTERPEVMYRVPSELAPNGNSVDATQEHKEFMDNALRYQASLQLLDSRIKVFATLLGRVLMSLFDVMDVASTR